MKKNYVSPVSDSVFAWLCQTPEPPIIVGSQEDPAPARKKANSLYC